MAPFGSLEILHTKYRRGHCCHVGLGGPGGTSAHEHLAYRTPDLDATRNKGIDPTKLGGEEALGNCGDSFDKKGLALYWRMTDSS